MLRANALQLRKTSLIHRRADRLLRSRIQTRRTLSILNFTVNHELKVRTHLTYIGLKIREYLRRDSLLFLEQRQE